jgi:hypothetical protein
VGIRTYAGLADSRLPRAIRRRAARGLQPLEEHVLSLQRSAGNRATTQLIARKPPAVAQKFKVVIVDDGSTGLNEKSMKVALDVVKKEIARVTSQSTDPLVKAGFEIEHRTDDPGRIRALGKSTFLLFLTPSTDAEHAIGLVAPHVDLDKEEQKQQKKRFASHVASEGGMHIDRVDGRKRSYGASLVSTTLATKMQDKEGAGPDSAGNLVGEIILHELGHAWGHETELGGLDHTKGGIMTASRILDSTLRYKASKFSAESVKIINARLEELAKRLAP